MGFLNWRKTAYQGEFKSFIEALSCKDHGDGRPEELGTAFIKLGHSIANQRLSLVDELINRHQK
jgi:hypothetical protein